MPRCLWLWAGAVMFVEHLLQESPHPGQDIAISTKTIGYIRFFFIIIIVVIVKGKFHNWVEYLLTEM